MCNVQHKHSAEFDEPYTLLCIICTLHAYNGTFIAFVFYTTINNDAAGSFLGLDSWGVSTSGWGSGLVGLECANAQNSYCVLLGCIRRRILGEVLYESWGVITPREGGVENSLRRCSNLITVITG